MGTKSEKDYGSLRQSFAEAVMTVLNFTAFLADNEDNPEIAVDARATATSEIEPPVYSSKMLCIVIGITKNLADLTLYTVPNVGINI